MAFRFAESDSADFRLCEVSSPSGHDGGRFLLLDSELALRSVVVSAGTGGGCLLGTCSLVAFCGSNGFLSSSYGEFRGSSKSIMPALRNPRLSPDAERGSGLLPFNRCMRPLRYSSCFRLVSLRCSSAASSSILRRSCSEASSPAAHDGSVGLPPTFNRLE